MAEHTLEATSGRVAGTLAHRDELWDRCYQELMATLMLDWLRRLLASAGITHTSTANQSTLATTMRLARPGCTAAFPTCCSAAALRTESRMLVRPLHERSCSRLCGEAPDHL